MDDNVLMFPEFLKKGQELSHIADFIFHENDFGSVCQPWTLNINWNYVVSIAIQYQIFVRDV